jgi:tRNA A37 threonylcarbamoyltransferase TsaD
VQAVDKFLLLGQSLDDAPGEAFDKVTIIMQLFPEKVKLVLRTRNY